MDPKRDSRGEVRSKQETKNKPTKQVKKGSKRREAKENMALQASPVNRNLHTRATFLGLEFEDLFVVLGLAAVMNVVSRFASGGASLALQYGVPLAAIPLLLAFKYGKPRGYFADLVAWHTRPRAYCAAARDRQINSPYINSEAASCR